VTPTLEEITAISNNRRLKAGPKAGLIWAKLNCTTPPTGTQLARGMNVCRKAAESWLRAWERHGYLWRQAEQRGGKWIWVRAYLEDRCVESSHSLRDRDRNVLDFRGFGGWPNTTRGRVTSG
jgi:hypothetical protein